MKKISKWTSLFLTALMLLACLAGCNGVETPTITPTMPPVVETFAGETTTPFESPSSSETTTAPTELVLSTQATTNPTETTAPTDTASSFSIHFINVGQADAALVECDGHYMLIDGGNKADSSRIYSVLKKTGIKKLDIVVGTHAHEDHIGGIPGAYNYCSADMTLCPVTSYNSKAFESFTKYANQKGGGITVPQKGEVHSLGSASVEILGLNAGADCNDTSIILRIDYGETSFIFAGDAERFAEQAVLNDGAELSATVLKVGHHGSDTSTTYPFLREIMPQYAVISVGADNSYGHPTDDTLSRLRDAEVKVFRTDLQGDIYCTSDGKTVTFNVEKNADADVFAAGTVAVPSVTDEEKLEEVVKASCERYNALPNKLLKGTLTYKIVNANQVKLTFNVGEPIYSDTEYKVDEALNGIRNYVLYDIEDAGLPSYIGVHVDGTYSLYSDTSGETPVTPTTTPTEAPAPQDILVWIPNSGSKYHSYAGCSGMKNPSQVTRTQAINMGYGACKKCW